MAIIFLEMNPQVHIDREALARFCRKWRIREMCLFGSAIREDFGPESDLDFLISFEPAAGWSLYDFVNLRDELAELTGREVDVVVKESIRNPYRKEEILSRYEVLFAA
jgi:uncharacterized protein